MIAIKILSKYKNIIMERTISTKELLPITNKIF